MGTKVNSNYEDLLTFTRASKGHALRPVSYGANELPAASFAVIGTGTWDGTQFVDTVGSQVRSGVTTGTSLTNGTTYALFINITDITGATQVRIDGLDGTDRLIGEGDHRFSFTSNGGTPRVRLEDTSTSINDGFTVQTAITAKEVLFDQPNAPLTLFEHPNNIPRVEYDADGNRLGLLVEESRTNLFLYSEDLTDSSWTKGSGTTVTPSTTVAPNGVSGCSRIQFVAGQQGTKFVQDALSPSPLASTTHTVSAWVKSTSGADQTFALKCTHGGVADYFSSDFTATSEWQRFDFSKAFGAGGTSAIAGIVGGSSGNAVDIEVWGFQFEGNASFPTSYIKSNSGSTTTRSADVASIPVADFGYNQSEGTVFVEASHFDTDSGTSQIVYLGDDTQDYVSVYTQYGSYYRVNSLGNGVSSGNIVLNTGGSLSDISKVATSWKNDASFDAARDGTLGTGYTDFNALGTVPTNVYFGTRNGSASPLNGHIKSIKYYPRRLTNAQLVQLTS
jgi:hypothetical protein